MACFLLPKWVVRCIDKIRRRFLWSKSQEDAIGISLKTGMQYAFQNNGGFGYPRFGTEKHLSDFEMVVEAIHRTQRVVEECGHKTVKEKTLRPGTKIVDYKRLFLLELVTTT